mmetsp:Transcript_43406/g.31705  ORF Transcript_43406/g.31705 Transcript_43406/m.31705 type:complete len:91 (+) Transcript_43406:751-1023(+)|eukprot:CAMPEP_0202967096 /NCGR_PEP_ID=MMETSP1396-20130829/11851_1 /ASSEMBLY_ACC=CAM_ASM_000872 /TAXON_ID= /ORGANISM="Pseudokeronopsis sp., Strain Brazil" /LENGTH=90 /DNA_ID=CAMNT_0049691771 /DNA_START=735 /DNA_END=1007 /DNA_ORIENTATION=+
MKFEYVHSESKCEESKVIKELLSNCYFQKVNEDIDYAKIEACLLDLLLMNPLEKTTQEEISIIASKGLVSKRVLNKLGNSQKSGFYSKMA